MFKKFISLAGAGLMLLGVSAPAFAYYSHGSLIRVYQSASSMADTGNNLQGNGLMIDHSGIGSVSGGGSNSMTTGNANANANTGSTVNTTINGWTHSSSLVKVTNESLAGANTGYNTQGNTALIDHSGIGTVGIGGDNTMNTGDANANANAFSTVNLTVNSIEVL